MESTPDRNVFQRIMSRIREGREGESDLSASEMPASMDMDKRGIMDKTKTGVKMPMKPPAARVASPAPRPVTAAPDPVMTAVDQAMPQMSAGRMGSDLRPAATTPAASAVPAAPRGPGTAPSMSQPQQWGGKGGYFYDYKPSKGTKGTPGYRPATITMHGGRYNNTAGTTIDETHTHFNGIIEELEALGDNRSPFMTLGAYQRQQAEQGNPSDRESALSAAAAELIPEPAPAPAPAPEPALSLMPTSELNEEISELRRIADVHRGSGNAARADAALESARVYEAEIARRNQALQRSSIEDAIRNSDMFREATRDVQNRLPNRITPDDRAEYSNVITEIASMFEAQANPYYTASQGGVLLERISNPILRERARKFLAALSESGEM